MKDGWCESTHVALCFKPMVNGIKKKNNNYTPENNITCK